MGLWQRAGAAFEQKMDQARAAAGLLLFGLGLATPPALAEPYPPAWNGAGQCGQPGEACHFPPIAWPDEPADPAQCGSTCGDWKPYTRFQGDINDPRVQDPSNGGTAPQNYVNIASSCVDKAYPSIYYALVPGATPDEDVIMFRWRVEQIANNYATGPSAGNFGATDPWSSALWSVLFDVDGDGYADLAAHLDGSSGSPAASIDRIAGIWSKLPNQSLDYLGDPTNVKLIAHNPTGFSQGSSLLNFQNSLSPTATWPSGAAASTWDYGTTRAKRVSTNSCNEYFVDYQIPVKMLDASALGGPKLTRASPIAMLFCTANSLNNPFQKDCALARDWVGAAAKPAPFGDYLSFDQATPYAQPIVSRVSATAPATCPGSYTLNATIQDTLAVIDGAVVPSVKAARFYYYHDGNGDGVANDGNAWTFAAEAAPKAGSLNGWSAGWDATGLARGQYLIGVQAVDDNTKVDDGATATGVDNRTFSYVAGDAGNRIHVDGNTYVALPPHSPEQTPGATENWYGNPDVTGNQTALVGVALNTCGKAPTLTKSVSPGTVAVGGLVDYTLTLTNNLLQPITLSQLDDALPDGFSYDSAQGGSLVPTGAPGFGAGTLAWTFSPALEIGAGASETLVFRAKASTVAGTYNNLASASTSFGTLASDPVPVGVDAARISLSKTPDTYRVSPGGTVTYTLDYANDSAVAVTGAVLTDTLPADVGCASYSVNGAAPVACSGTSVAIPLGTLGAGETGSVSLVATVAAGYGSASLLNTASLDVIAPDGSPVTRTATSSIGVNVPQPAFTLKKTGDAVRVAPGTATTWTLAYRNYGTGAASGVTLSDVLPAGFSYASCTGGCSHSNGSVTWNLGSIAAGAGGSVTVTATAAANPFTYPNPAVNSATLTWTADATGVSASSEVGVTGDSCSAVYYFHGPTGNRTATLLAPELGAASVSESPGTTTLVFPGSAPAGGLAIGGQTLRISFYMAASTGNATFQVTLYNVTKGEAIATSATQGVANSGGVAVLQQFTATVGAGVTIDAGDQLEWRFTLGGSGQLPSFWYSSPTHNSRSSFCDANAPANLALAKSVDQANIATASGSLNYLLDYANTGGSDATGVVLTDTLPAGVSCSQYTATCSDWTNVPASCSAWTACSGSTLNLTPGGGTLAAGAAGKYLVQASVDGGASGTLSNSATLSANGLTPASASADTSVGVLGGGAPALALAKEASRTLLSAGDIVTYTLTVANIGAAPASNVQVSDSIPVTPYFTYVPGSIHADRNDNADPADDVVTDDGGDPLTWTLASLAAGDTARLSFQMQAAATGIPDGITSLDNSASAGADGGLSATSGTVTVSVSGNPALVLTKSASPDSGLSPGDSVTYTLTVTNSGSAVARSVLVTDPIPAGLAYAGGGSFDAIGNRVVFAVGDLAAGASAAFSFDATVVLPPAGSTAIAVTNTASASAANAAPVTAGASLTGTAMPALSLVKQGPSEVAYPAASLVQTAADASTVFVDGTTRINVGQSVRINGSDAVVTAKTATTLVLDAAVSGAIGDAVVPAVTYTLSYQNTGKGIAPAVLLTDTLPAGAIFVAASQGGTENAGTVTWNLGNLEPGAAGSISVTLLPGGPGELRNDAGITCAGCNTPVASATAEVGGLVVSKRTSTPYVRPGDPARYEITVTNTLASAVAGFTVTDTLPAGFSHFMTDTILIDGQPEWAAGLPANGDQALTWSGFTAAIPAGKSLVLGFTANVGAGVGPATYQNEAGGTSPVGGVTPYDPLLSTAEDVTVLASGTGLLDGYIYRRNDDTYGYDLGVDTPLAGVEVMIEQSAGDCATPGSSTCYVVHTDAAGYYSAVLPAGDWRVAVDADSGDLTASGLTLVVGDNPAAVTVPDQGSASNDNGYGAPYPDMSASLVLPAAVGSGGAIAGSLTCTNLGAVAAPGATCSVTAGGSLGSCAVAGNPVSLPVASLAAGASIVCTLSATAPASGTVLVSAATGASGDGNPDNDTASAAVAVIDAVDDGSANLTQSGSGSTRYGLLGNDTVSASAATVGAGGNVSQAITGVTLDSASIANPFGLDAATGELIVANTTAAGTYVVTYRICAVIEPTACDSAAKTVIVTATLPVALADMRVTLTGFPASTSAGVEVAGLMTCSNQGAVAAVDATCAITSGGTAANCRVAGNPATLPVASLAVGASIACDVGAVAPPAGTLTVNAATGAGNDSGSVGKRASQSVTVTSAPGTGSISGSVWYDLDRNGSRGNGEPGRPGWAVQLLSAGVVRSTATTGGDGGYLFGGLQPGIYTVRFVEPNGQTLTSGLLPVNGDSGGNGGTPSYSQLNGIVVTAGVGVVDQSLPIDPSGVVYDSLTRQPLSGATVTLLYNGSPVSGLYVAGGSASQVTGADGRYQFFLLPSAPDGSYGLAVTRAGYRFPSVLIPASDGSAFTGGPVTAIDGAPQGGQDTTYYLGFPKPSTDLTNNHIPLDAAPAHQAIPVLSGPGLAVLAVLVLLAGMLARRGRRQPD
jgi:uncharacterized repeat protein (TIGR01451 family)